MKTAIVFGSSGGIGSAIRKRLEDDGYSVLDDSDVDVTVPEQVTQRVVHPIDVMVFSVGAPFSGYVLQSTLDEWRRGFSLYIEGLLNCISAVLPIMQRQRSGYIINIGALRAFSTAKGKAVYCSCKAAAATLMDVLAKEAAEFNIEVTSIHPGFTDTEFHKHNTKRPYIDGKKVPITQPEDIANAVSFLLSLSPGAVVNELCIGKAFDTDMKGLEFLPCTPDKQ